MSQFIQKSGVNRGPGRPFAPVQRWYRGEPVSASKLNQIVDGINRITTGVRPPEQTRVFRGGGGGGGFDPAEARILGEIRFFSE
jgi:hypothetical protein